MYPNSLTSASIYWSPLKLKVLAISAVSTWLASPLIITEYDDDEEEEEEPSPPTVVRFVPEDKNTCKMMLPLHHNVTVLQ